VVVGARSAVAANYRSGSYASRKIVR
jgi:hypothetical protein